MWDDLTQEETRRGYLQGNSSHHKDDEENVALATKGKKKKKFKKGSKDGAKQHDGENNDMSKVKCFACQSLDTMLDSVQTRRRRSSRQQLKQRLMSLLLDLRETFLSLLVLV